MKITLFTTLMFAILINFTGCTDDEVAVSSVIIGGILIGNGMNYKIRYDHNQLPYYGHQLAPHRRPLPPPNYHDGYRNDEKLNDDNDTTQFNIDFSHQY